MNKFRLMKRILGAILLLGPLMVSAQKLDSMMNIYASNYPQEKIHVHFDKKIYSAGETIWFKAYIFTGADPSPISRNFYAELTDANGNVIDRKTAPVMESTTAGNFDLPKNLKAGHLHFRAYTTWMSNFDTAFYYEKDIRIYDKNDSVWVIPQRQTSVSFFPEGGDLVAGVENTVAFKANDQYGLPVSISGSLVDGSGKELIQFSSVHDGLGKFLVTPEKNDSLFAVWKDEKGIEHKTKLPEVKTIGVVLRAISGNQKILFSVARSADGGPEYKHLLIMAHMHQHLVYKAKINLEDNFMSGGTIPTNQLPSGVLQVTVFNEQEVPVAERVVFVNNHEYGFSPILAVLGQNLNRRGKNTLQVEVPDTLRSNFSLSVTDATTDGVFPGDDNIVSRLLLTGEIKGYVHNPYYYFSNESDSLASQLDLVMLTHGWRKFRWDMLTRGRTPVIKNPEQEYLSMKVEVLGVDPYKVSRDESLNVILSKKDSSTQMLSLPRLSGAGAKFGVTGLMFFDTARAYYMFNVNKKLSGEAAVTFNTGLLRNARMLKLVGQTYDGWTAEDSIYLRRNHFIAQEAARVAPIADQKIKTLESVTVKGRVKSEAEKLDERYTSGMFSGGDAYTFDLVNDPFSTSMMDIFQYLQGKVAGLQIVTSGPGGSPTLSWRGGKPSLYLNEMQVDPQQLQSTPVSDIAMVKVFRPGSGVGFGGGAGGVIAVYTKKGGDQKPSADFKGLDHAFMIGYSVMRQFYSPDYSKPTPEQSLEDLRTTLYWKPFILTDKDTKRVSIEFYNNDITKKMRVVLEGINEDGKLVHIEKIIQ